MLYNSFDVLYQTLVPRGWQHGTHRSGHNPSAGPSVGHRSTHPAWRTAATVVLSSLTANETFYDLIIYLRWNGFE